MPVTQLYLDSPQDLPMRYRYTILCYTMRYYYALLCYVMLYYEVPAIICYEVHAILCYDILCYAVKCRCIMLCCAMKCYKVPLYYAMLCYEVPLYYALLCYVMLRQEQLFSVTEYVFSFIDSIME